MNLVAIYRAFDALMTLRAAVKGIRTEAPPPPPASELTPTVSPGLTGQLETRLTNVVVAALKEAFDRDHARLELERAHLDEQRRRAETAMRLELRRQAADRETGRLRWLAGTALVGWVASVAILAAGVGEASPPARIMLAAGWVLLLASLASAFNAQNRLGALTLDEGRPFDVGASGTAALWLLVAGLGLSAGSLLL
jgi:hypothetical protein